MRLVESEYWLLKFASTVRLEILNAMEKRGMIQAELAEQTGISPSQISLLLSGKRRLHLGTLSDIALALDMRPIFELRADKNPKRSSKA